jgi:hypothetical protein
MGQQVPSRSGRLQATHGPWQATLQQTPFPPLAGMSAQNVDAHWSADLQGAPFGRLPQLPETHAWPATHCWFVVQSS